MNSVTFVISLLLLSAVAYRLGIRRALGTTGGRARARTLHSLPHYYGTYTAIWCALPALLLLALWGAFESFVITQLVVAELPHAIRTLPSQQLALFLNDVRNVVSGNIVANVDATVRAAADHYRQLTSLSHLALTVVGLVLCIVGGLLALQRITPTLRARHTVEHAIKLFLILSSAVAIFTTIGIVLSVLFESIRFFSKVAPIDFIFGLQWSPQTAIRADQVGSSGAFGAVPLFAGTALISLIALLVAAPIGLLSAIYLAEYATPRLRAVAKPTIEILAGIPTVVYGFFAALTLAPMLRNAGDQIGIAVSSESALAAGCVMGLMLIPFVSSLSDDVINAVPQSLRDGSYGLGATKSETILKVILPAALPGIVGSLLLAVSRAIGETMIVVMAAGLAANLTANPLEAVTTVTVQIVTLLIGDQEFDSAKTLAAFALGLMLFAVTLALNVVALHVVKKYREQYD